MCKQYIKQYYIIWRRFSGMEINSALLMIHSIGMCVGEGGSEGSKEEQFFFSPKTVNNWN